MAQFSPSTSLKATEADVERSRANARTGILSLAAVGLVGWLLFFPPSWLNLFGSKSPAFKVQISEATSTAPTPFSRAEGASEQNDSKESTSPGPQAQAAAAKNEQNTVPAQSALSAAGAPTQLRSPLKGDSGKQKNGLAGLAGLAAMAPLALPTKTPPPEATILFTETAGRHSVLGRSDTQGTCKGFLGAFGQGWLPYADPAFAGNDLAAVSAPNGSCFALLTTRGGSVNLWLLSADGRQAQALTQDDSGIAKAGASTRDIMAFSPDSSHLAYVSRGELWVVDLKSLQSVTLTFDGGIRSLCWSPAGDSLAVVRYDSVHLVSLNGSDDQVLVPKGCDEPDLAWSGDTLYYMAGGLRTVNLSLSSSVVLASAVHPNCLALTQQGVAMLTQIQTEGRTEAILADGGKGKSSTMGKQDGGAFTQVTQGGAQELWASADGKSLFFLRDQLLWRCELDGSKAKPLGSVPMGNVSVANLSPLPWACR